MLEIGWSPIEEIEWSPLEEIRWVPSEEILQPPQIFPNEAGKMIFSKKRITLNDSFEFIFRVDLIELEVWRDYRRPKAYQPPRSLKNLASRNRK
jgi:hypothetical protein